MTTAGPAGPAGDGRREQGHHWSRHAPRYDDLFLDPYREGVDNPIPAALRAIPDAASKSIIDLGCGTGPLLPLLVAHFAEVVALDFAPGMIRSAKARLGEDAGRVRFEARAMDDLAEFAGRFDAAVAVNSLVMPDVREIDRSLSAIRAALRDDGLFLGVVPSIDAIHYHTMLLMDRALDEGHDPEAAERLAIVRGEHALYEFAFGRFSYRGLHQKFWQPFEVEYRLRKAGFRAVELGRVLYPWDADQVGGAEFDGLPRSWDWTFAARP